jgi:hypothetical protein
MTFKFLKIIGIGFILSVSTLANATLIDNGDYTTDTVSGLDWLDWTLTGNKTQAEALYMFSGAGWRIATAAEATGLIANRFGIPGVGSNGRPGMQCCWPAVDGATPLKFEQLFGLYYAMIEGHGLVGADQQNVYANHNPSFYGLIGTRESWAGVALVKGAAVSEPAIIALFALGLVGIGFARRRQS